MKSNASIGFGLFLCLAVIGYYGYLIVSSGAFKSANAIQPPSSSAAVFTLDDTTFSVLHSRELNGELPITLNDSELGKESPF